MRVCDLFNGVLHYKLCCCCERCTGLPTCTWTVRYWSMSEVSCIDVVFVLRVCYVCLQDKLHLQRAEEERWKDIPEWKRKLICEKEKKRGEELVLITTNIHISSFN